jgi:hypothetical protein
MEAQLQVRHNAQEVQDYVRDLYAWEKDMKRKDKGTSNQRPDRDKCESNFYADLLERQDVSLRCSCVMCALSLHYFVNVKLPDRDPGFDWCRSLSTTTERGTSAGVASTSCKKTRMDSGLTSRTPLPGQLTAARHTYEYSGNKWDKFDVDAALAAVSDESDSENKKNVPRRDSKSSNGEVLRELHKRKLHVQPQVGKILDNRTTLRGEKHVLTWICGLISCFT